MVLQRDLYKSERADQGDKPIESIMVPIERVSEKRRHVLDSHLCEFDVLQFLIQLCSNAQRGLPVLFIRSLFQAHGEFPRRDAGDRCRKGVSGC